MDLLTGRAGVPRKSSPASSYQPIVRGYFSVAALYYAAMSISHLTTPDMPGQVELTSAALITAALASLAAFALRRPRPLAWLEAVTTGINALVLANVLIALEIDYSSAKLSYFIMMTMIFGLAWVSLRQSLLSLVATLAALNWELSRHDPHQIGMYGVLSIGAAMTSVGITYLVQRAISLALAARQQAEEAQQDAEERLLAAEQLGEAMRQQSLLDSLTGLPNRRAFFETLADRKAAKVRATVWLVMLDLDGFKAVNDNYGHVIGDELLKAVADRLRAHCGEKVHVSRMGGDEFNFILAGDTTQSAVQAWSEQLLQSLAEVYVIEDRLIQISGSIGCYRAPLGEAEAKLLQCADYALLHAKRNGKNRVVLFRRDHAQDAAQRFRIEQALRVADFASEIELAFQPQFDLGRNRITCAEALARWNSPILGPVAPDAFIKIAEDSGLVARITLTVLDKAIATLQQWPDPIPLSINLSGHDLMSDLLIEQIIDRVRDSCLPAGLIEFEVTETAMMTDTRRASDNLLRLTQLGHPIALDDFGTGYSNFKYLRTLPIRKLKIDRSFLENLGDPMTEKILHSLSGMARNLDVDCLLEGIESELELIMAKRIGAQLVQGYLFGKPMSAGELSAMITPKVRAIGARRR